MAPPRIALRRAVADDQKSVTTLVAKSGGASRYRKRYGAFNSSLLDSSYLSIVAYDPEDEDGALLGFISFSDGPRDSVAEPWINEANNLFGQRWTTHSLLWIAFMVADPIPDIEQRAIEKMMRAAFSTLPEIDFAVCILPYKEDMPNEMSKYFRKLRSGEQGAWLPGGAVGGAKGGESVFLCEREMLVPSLAVRKAVVEDNDDLVPIFQEQEDALKECYGNFYLAELIKNQDSNNVTLVAEHAGRAIGLIALSRMSGTDHLSEHFNLNRYGNLVKIDPSLMTKDRKNGGGTDSDKSDLIYSVVGGEVEDIRSICSKMSESASRLVHIDPLSLVDEDSDKDDDSLMVALIAKRLRSPDVKAGGAILENYPTTSQQALLLAKASILPTSVICCAKSIEDGDDELKALYKYLSSGGRTPNTDEGESKEAEEKKSEGKEEGKDQDESSDLVSFVPPNWLDTNNEASDWLKIVLDEVNPKEDLSVGFEDGAFFDAPSNAFSITMFCLDGLFESRASDFMPHAFKAFPDLDYCILTVPTTVLLESRIVRGFTPALPRPGTSYSQSLYVIHKDTILASTYLKVQRLFPGSLNNSSEDRKNEINQLFKQQKLDDEEDIAAGGTGKDPEALAEANKKIQEGFKLGLAVEKVIKGNLSAEKANDVRKLLSLVGGDDQTPISDNPPRSAFVATIGNTGAIAIVILDRSSLSADRINFFKANFDLEQYLVMDRFRTKAQAIVTALVVDPIFHHQTRFILKEAMRLFDKNLIYYQSDPTAPPNSWSFHPPRLVYQHFTPVTPRSRAQPRPLDPQPFNITAANAKVDHISEKQIAYEKQDHTMDPKGFSLQFLSRAMLSEPRLSVQARIVVVGATATTASFLRRFLLNPQILYSNVTIVSPTGFPQPSPLKTAASLQVINEDMPTEIGLSALTLESRCRLLLASVTSIDRENKTLTLCRTDCSSSYDPYGNDIGEVMPYDYLILTDELIDSTKYNLAESNGNASTLLHQSWNSHIEDGTAIGMSNDLVSPVISLSHPNVDPDVLKAIEASNGGDIIVYGATLQAAAAVGGLLANGVSPKRISFIRPGWVTPQLVEKEENRTPTVEAELKGNRRKSMNEMKESESKKDEDEFGEEFSDWVRLKGCFLGDERAENIMTDTLKSLGIYDRNDLELLGVSGSKGLNNNGTITSGGQGGGGGGVPSSSSSHASRSTANQRSRVTTGEDNDSIGGGSSSAFSSGIGGGYEEKDDLDVYDDNHSDFDGYHPSEEIQKVPISDIEMAVFQKMGTSETLSLSCSVLLTCHNLNIRPSLFKAINDSGLAYDGRLVVQPSTMQTSDPHIFAAGDVTKFSRKYAHLCHDHCYLSNFEIGRYLADSFSTFVHPINTIAPGEAQPTNQLAPSSSNASYFSSSSSIVSSMPQTTITTTGGGGGASVSSAQAESVDLSVEVPTFKKPRTLSCCLPGGYHARSTLASAIDPKMVVKEKDGQLVEEASGTAAWNSLNTGAVRGKGTSNKSSVLRLDINYRLVDFSYIGPTPVEARNIGCLIGLHASYVNGCASVHQKGGVSDWITFFRSEWAQALYHDRFPQLIELLRNRLKADDAAKDVLELMKRAVEDGKDDQAVATILTNAIGSEGERVTPGTAKRVEQVGFEWLTSNKSSFPLYKLPDRATNK